MSVLPARNVLYLDQRSDLEPALNTRVPSTAMDNTFAPSLVQRSASSSTCAADNDSGVCQKPADSGNAGSLTIGLAAALPITVALIVLFFLHRRIRRKLRAEDANDKHASLDFGMGAVPGSKKSNNSKKPGQQMAAMDVEKSLRPNMRGRGLSMDMSSPYLLPAALSESNGSLHSMSRTVQDSADPYRPVTFIKSDRESSRSSRPRQDNASTYTSSTGRSNDAVNAGLLKNASRMSYLDHSQDSHPSLSSAPRNNPVREASLPSQAQSKDRWYPNDGPQSGDPLPRKESATLATYNQAPLSEAPLSNKPRLPPFPQPAPQAYHRAENTHSDYTGFDFNDQNQIQGSPMLITPPTPTYDRQSPQEPTGYSREVSQPEARAPPQTTLNVQPIAVDARRLSAMGTRPLPPDDPTDNPEQRANRIRSFYKEYFDDSRPNPAGQYPQENPYDNGESGDYFEDGAVYDPETGAFYSAQAPYAQDIVRRARTPPPRGPPPFARGHRSTNSTQSAGRSVLPFQQGSQPPMPKKIAPPPMALQSLPTPHMLKGDGGMYSPIDFAPPTSYRDRQLGRGLDSPTGTSRPYSPAVPIHNPLVRSFDDLNVMPSPHALRKSGAFTGLDFAPPPRFKNNDGNASDAGSIRSNRSGISQVQRDAIRAGAYRLSKMDPDMVGSRQDLASSLKPQWDMRKM